MAERPAVKTRQLTRDKLASFLKSQELIKAFENLANDVSSVLPDAIYLASNTGAILGVDASEDAGAFTDAPGMVLSLDKNASYLVSGIFTFQSNASVPTVELGFLLPSGSSISGQYGNSIDTTALSGTSAPAGSVAATGRVSMITGTWLLRTGGTAGDAQMRFRSVVPSYSVTLKSGRCALLAKRIS